ncbi:MAG: hypothetical protein H7Y11_07440, partial [Armatimonadetes bacterium]|nr:hypothetical protein [Anaerolineae bacterium]
TQMAHNIERVQQTVALTIAQLDVDAVYPAHTALDEAIVTMAEVMSPEVAEKLAPILARRFGRA